MNSFSSSLSAHTSAAVPVQCLLMLRHAGSRLASPSCSWRRRNALLLFLRHQSRSTLPLVLPCSTQPSSSLHPPAHTTSTARPLAELSTHKASSLPCASPEHLASPETAAPTVHTVTSRHGRRARLRRSRPTPVALAPFFGNNSSTHGCAQALACSSTSPSPPTSVNRPEIEPLRHPLFFKIATGASRRIETNTGA